ncbi:MAG TPA: FecR domain-containing protein [Cytophagaceae bacterium]|jgi:ferric-dicitrate binding protein FerR (iron transport regulator)
MENKYSDRLELIEKCLRGDASAEEQGLLLSWRNAKPEHEQYFNEVRDVWKLTENPKDGFEPDVDAAWNKLERRLFSNPKEHIRKGSKQRTKMFHLQPWMQIAATILLIVSAGLWAMNRWKQQDARVQFATADKKEMIYLPDSSKVWLNAHTKISYSKDFNDNHREVMLDGEAFFEVRKAKGMSFTVVGHTAKVEVLGTSFNVKAYRNEPLEEVEVFTGKVAFSSQKDRREKVFLFPGDKAKLKKDEGIAQEKMQNENTLAWKTERLSFDNESLKEVAVQLSAYFKKEIILSENRLEGCRFTGTFEKPVLEDVLQVITLSTNTTVKKSGNNYQLTGEGCDTDLNP